MCRNRYQCTDRNFGHEYGRRHCVINVKRNKQGILIYTLRDAPSLTGTFLNNEILNDKDRIRIEDGAIVTIGATTFILRAAE